MPKGRREIGNLLDRLDRCPADDLESQDLDFKEWDTRSLNQSVRTLVTAAVCMANGGGGTVVFGVADKLVGRDCAIRGVPPEVSVNRLKLAVHDGTDPKLTPVFEELRVREGTGRLILMHVHPGIPPYTDTAGRGTVRIGKDCKPLTGTLRRKLLEESGENDYTAVTIEAPLPRLVSPVAMESLREAAKVDRAPADLLRLGDADLLQAIGVIRDGKPTRAAVLLAGSPDTVREHIPGFVWTHLRMSSNTDYSDRADGNDAIPLALSRLMDRIMADNPIETVRRGPYHFEYRTYPEVALREALLNALCHGDYRVAGPRLVRQYADRIEISNPGGLIGDITPDNILRHAPAARNPCLVQALVRLRLVNRSNLGMERIFSALLMEGKPPPEIEDTGGAVRLTFRASRILPLVRGFVAEEARRKIVLGADQLLVLGHLVQHGDIDAPTASRLCQRRERTAADVLARMESEFGYVERRGSGPGMYWTLSPEVHARLVPANDFREGPKIIIGADSTVTHRDPHGAWDGLKTRVVRVIRRCAETGAEPLANAEVRRITGLDRHQVRRLIHELRDEGLVAIEGHGRAARYLSTPATEGRSVTENGIEDSRNGAGTGFPARISHRKCAKIARNSISRALSIENATEKRFCAIPETFSSGNASEMREYSFRVAFSVGNVSRNVRTRFSDAFPRLRGRKRIGNGPCAFVDSPGGKPGGTQ